MKIETRVVLSFGSSRLVPKLFKNAGTSVGRSQVGEVQSLLERVGRASSSGWAAL